MSTGTLNEMEESFHILPMPLKPKFDCTFCEKTFTIKQSLKSHLGCVHGFEGDFACNRCHRTYTSNEKLEKHLQSSKRHNSTFLCNDCGKEYGSQSALKLHLEEHTGQKYAHKCPTEGCQRGLVTNITTF